MNVRAAIRAALPSALLLIVASGALGQIVKKGQTYTFRARYVKGKTIRYGFLTVIEPMGSGAAIAKQRLTFPVSLLVQGIVNDKNHGRVAKIKSDAGPWLLNGKEYRPLSSVTVSVDSLNRIVHGPASDVPQFTTPLPEKPIKIGGTWTADIDPGDSTPMPLKVKATYTFQKVVGKLAFIGISLSGKGEGETKVSTSGKGTMVLRLEDGTLHSISLNQTVIIGNSVGAKTAITVNRRA